jgi:hypothetical protein
MTSPSSAVSAARKNEDAPCAGPRDAEGRSICGRHCGSKNRQGYPCSQHSMSNGRCRTHGGKSLIGAASPRFKHGRNSRYSSVLCGTALSRYEDALQDPAHVELKNELALIDALLMDALERSQLGRLGSLWDELLSSWESFRVAERNGDTAAAGRALRRIGEIATEGAAAHRAQVEVVDLIERKRRLAESERRRLLDENQMISAARALAFAGAVVAVVRRHVDDRATLAAISADLAQLVHQDL